jgi:hypothetical protein
MCQVQIFSASEIHASRQKLVMQAHMQDPEQVGPTDQGCWRFRATKLESIGFNASRIDGGS